MRIFYQEGKVRVILRRHSSEPASQPDDDVGRTHDACMKALPLFSEFVAPLFPLLFATQHAQKRTGSVLIAYVALQSFEGKIQHHLVERGFMSKIGPNLDHTLLECPVACQPATRCRSPTTLTKPFFLLPNTSIRRASTSSAVMNKGITQKGMFWVQRI